MDTFPGSPTPLGFFNGNFAIHSAHADQIILGLFAFGAETPTETIPLNRTGNVWHIGIKNLPPNTYYSYQIGGRWLLDPYAKFPETNPIFNSAPLHNICAAAKMPEPFDWQNAKRPQLPQQDLIIYELHVRGFTKHASSKTSSHGTYAALIEKIPYFKELGINAIELMPIHEFDECHSKNKHPKTNERLPNYWGYNPISYFAPKRSYAKGDPVTEFKTLVREMHKNGIEVILDVVYNHTGEGSEKDYAICWRGIDEKTYYLEKDYTGCGNTLNANHPPVQTMILDSLRYFADEFHVDGFRFDLASTFTRGTDGAFLPHPPILEAIAKDLVLSKLKLIAEPWDMSLYQVGAFPKWGPWSEWNGRYRDIMRRFFKGTDGYAGPFAAALCGSDFLYKTPLSSINFIIAHDGYTLRDLVTYQNKHNFDNGEQNHDGNNENDNWNCGVEGPTADPQINALRERQMCNHLLALFLSLGIPMFYMGDEYGHTRNGNNNPYVQDNELNWFLWDKKNPAMFRFIQDLIAFRKSEGLGKNRFLTNADITWHTDFKGRFVAFSTKTLYAAFNANWQPKEIELPPGNWHLVVDTKDPWLFQTKGPEIKKTELLPYSALIARLNP